MQEFTSRYRNLNDAQKTAVDTIEGPVMVVAGPGTGKTELLSLRVANILRLTDTLPGNILCLTFTESGAAAMRQRLVGLIGPDAYKVAIHTFHSFGSDIIASHPEYFYHGAHFRPADELSAYEVLLGIFDKLPHDNPLSSKVNGAYTHLRDVQRVISDMKKSGLTSDEIGHILDRNDAFCAWIQPRLNEVFSARLSKKALPLINDLATEVMNYQEDAYELIGYHPLYRLIGESLMLASQSADEAESTTPISAWKRTYLEKNEHGEPVLKDARRSVKIRAAAGIYYDYLLMMHERALYDFDDMILRVVHALEVFGELRYSLQESYQYLLVDEFQDTNDAQMRLVWNLSNNPASNNRPNVLVVGDDDQAIYRFQGANLSNILDFRTMYDGVQIITLTDNYRSDSTILKLSRAVITQGTERLEHLVEEIDKTLTPHHNPDISELRLDVYESRNDEYYSIATRVAAAVQRDPGRSRAIIARKHSQLRDLVPYLRAHNIPLAYEKEDDPLESEPVMQLELVARIVAHLGRQEFPQVDELMPQLLAHPAWGIERKGLWSLSLDAHKNRRFWLEIMLETPGRLQDIAEWLVVSAHMSLYQPLEYMLDALFGVSDTQLEDSPQAESDEPFSDGPHEDFVSPLRSYFFPHDSLEQQPGRYVQYLVSLRALRQKLREYQPDNRLMLSDFVNFIDMHRELGIRLQGNADVHDATDAVTLVTAHKSKGLEYDDVYVVQLTDSTWGATARPIPKLINFPNNLPLGISGDTADERLRLLYVALTRAKSCLYLSTHQLNDSQKATLLVGALSGEHVDPTIHESLPQTIQLASLTTDWRSHVLDIDQQEVSQLLGPVLERYQLSATHLGNYLDVTKGGPELFLLQNLLRFPQAMSPSSAYGSSIHGALQRAHAHLAATGKRRPVEDVLHDFETLLTQCALSEEDTNRLLKRGSDSLHAFLSARYDSFTPTQIVERSFGSEHVCIGEARVTGAIDLLDIDDEQKSIIVTDYKTGKAIRSWKGATEFDKIKLHHYQQQLMMYKLLVENSRHYAGYTVKSAVIEFVEPDSKGDIVRLEYEYDSQTLDEFKQLLSAVWNEICNMHFSAPNELPISYAGIQQFEELLRQKYS